MIDRQPNGTKITTYNKDLYRYYSGIINNKCYRGLGYVLSITSQGIPILAIEGAAIKKYTIVFTDDSIKGE